MLKLLIVIILIFLFFILLSCAIKQQIDYFSDCKNTPPNFKKAYSKMPNQYKIAPIPAKHLGADETMVALGQGSCASNINGVNKNSEKNIYGFSSPYGDQSYAYCVFGSKNPFSD